MTYDWTINVGNLIAIETFLAAYLVRWISAGLEQRRARRKFFVALYTEIKLNVESLDEAVAALPSTSAIGTFLATSSAARPHMVFSYMAEIYRSNLVLLPSLPDVLIRNIIQFYSNLELIDALVASFENGSYQVISGPGRVEMFERLRHEFQSSRQHGRAMMDSLKRELEIPDLR